MTDPSAKLSGSPNELIGSKVKKVVKSVVRFATNPLFSFAGPRPEFEKWSVVGYPLSYWVQLAHDQMRIYQQGSYAEQVTSRALDFAEWYRAITWLQGAIWFNLSLLITILLGFYAGRRRVFEDVSRNAAWIRRATAWCLGLGILANFAGI